MSSPFAVWTWAVATEVMLLAVGVWLSKLVLDRWRPGRPRGMASRGEAERLLGVTRLRKVRSVVRPDLYGMNRDEGEDDRQPAEVGWRLGRAYEPAAGSCGCRGIAPLVLSARRAAARLLICSRRRFFRRLVRRW